MMSELTDEQIRQAELTALRIAADSVKKMPLRLPEKLGILENLIRAGLRLEDTTSLQGDLETRSLLVNFKKEKYAEIEAVLDKNTALQRLGQFGRVPGVLIRAVFKSADISFPLELQTFHAAFQREVGTFFTPPVRNYSFADSKAYVIRRVRKTVLLPQYRFFMHFFMRLPRCTNRIESGTVPEGTIVLF